MLPISVGMVPEMLHHCTSISWRLALRLAISVGRVPEMLNVLTGSCPGIGLFEVCILLMNIVLCDGFTDLRG